jgi:23S rRNA C2498 (ribose-2'-O)-methylase RlmM
MDEKVKVESKNPENDVLEKVIYGLLACQEAISNLEGPMNAQFKMLERRVAQLEERIGKNVIHYHEKSR